EFQHRAVECLAHLAGALVEVKERVYPGADDHGDPDSLRLHETGQIDNHLGEGRQVSAESLEQTLELGNYEDKQDERDYDCNREHRSRIEQGLLDLLLQGLGFLLVGCNLVEQGLERAGLLARLDEIDKEIVKIQRVLGQRFMERRATFDVGLNIQNQLLHGGL